MKTILVTGGTGLVGKSLQEIYHLYSNEYFFQFISSKYCDLTNFENSKQIFSEINPNYVIHLAANVGGLYKNINENEKMFDDNIQINTNVVKLCELFNVEKCICILSTCIFPDKTEYPINETMLHNGPPHYSNEGYAYAKRILEVQTKLYNNSPNKKTHFVCVIPTNIYGPFDNFSLKDGHVIPALMHQCYLSLKNNTSFVVKGKGTALRQFIYSKDLAKLLMIIMEHYESKDPIILSPCKFLTQEQEPSENEYTIREVVNLIAETFNQSQIKFDETYNEGQYKKTADSNKLKNFLEMKNIEFEFTSLKEGIKETVEWFIKNYNTARI
jgi:GDP-L-fucose synthase